MTVRFNLLVLLILTLVQVGLLQLCARYSGDGFMKILQVHDGPYAPTPNAFGVSRDAGIDGVVLDLTFDDGSLI